MINYVSQLLDSECPLTSLEIEGNTKGALKSDLLPFLFSLMVNKTLTHLDIRLSCDFFLLTLIAEMPWGTTAPQFYVVFCRLTLLFALYSGMTSIQQFKASSILHTRYRCWYFATFNSYLLRNSALCMMPMPVVDISHEIARLDKQPNFQVPQLIYPRNKKLHRPSLTY